MNSWIVINQYSFMLYGTNCLRNLSAIDTKSSDETKKYHVDTQLDSVVHNNHPKIEKR